MKTKDFGVVYTIKHKADKRVCYVGQTRQSNPRRRWQQHWSAKKTAISQALSLIGCRDDFEFSIIEQVPVSKLDEREEHWISELDTLYPNGLNRVSRAVGCPDYVRAKMAKSRRGKRHSAEVRAKMSEAHKRRMADPAELERMRDAQKARWSAPRPPKTPKPPKPRKPRMKQPCTPERRAKLVEAAKRRWADPEFRARASASMAQRSANPEYRAKLAAAWERRRARQDTGP